MGPTYMKIGPSVQYKNLQLIFVMGQVARRHQKPPSYLKSIDWMKNGLRVVIFSASLPYILGPVSHMYENWTKYVNQEYKTNFYCGSSG